MASDGKTPSSQSGFFSDSGELGGSHPQFTEICTALYERELLHIAHNGPANVSILRRRLAGLPHHIRSVARFLVSRTAPLDIDAHNGSWVIKQPAKCPGISQTIDKKQMWYAQHADYGLVVPVAVSTLEGIHLELDSIDKVDNNSHALHTNKLGWFTFSGEQILRSVNANSVEKALLIEEGIDESAVVNKANSVTKMQLLKPTTAIMSSACSGHTWRHKSKGAPRALSLREMRLSTQIKWKHFTLN